jgi:hypothetical protein
MGRINSIEEAGNPYGITKFSKLTELGEGWMKEENLGIGLIRLK